MKKYFLLALAGFLLTALPLPAFADDGAAQYNFASSQGDKNISVVAGAEGSGLIYFYNIDGNRITHIALKVAQAPADWDVTIDPPLAEAQFLVSEMPVTVTESLYVEPTELLDEEPSTVPEGLVSLKIPGRGYTLGKLSKVNIAVPAGTPIGTTGTIKVNAEAFWLGQTGAAAIKQVRDFDFTVTVVSGATEYSETVYTEAPSTEPTEPTPETSLPEETPITAGEEIEEGNQDFGNETESAAPAVTNDATSASPDNPVMDWLPAIIAGVIVVLGAILIPRMVGRKRKE